MTMIDMLTAFCLAPVHNSLCEEASQMFTIYHVELISSKLCGSFKILKILVTFCMVVRLHLNTPYYLI